MAESGKRVGATCRRGHGVCLKSMVNRSRTQSLKRAANARPIRALAHRDEATGYVIFAEGEIAMENNFKPSRRSALRAAALLAGAALTGSIVPSRKALAQKASKDAMKYQDKPNGEHQCSNCL